MPNGVPNATLPHAVYIRQFWADAWTFKEFLYCDSMTFACGPDFSRAELSWKYGNIQQLGTDQFAEYTKLSINEWYVKIVLGDQIWYGIVLETERIQGGNGFNDTNTPPNRTTPETGIQTLTCIGLEYLLEREIYDSSFVKLQNPSGTVIETEVFRGLAFNMGGSSDSSRRLQANCDVTGSLGAPVFCENPAEDGSEWTGDGILMYLLTYHSPRDSFGSDNLGWSLAADASDNATLNSIRPKLDVHGQTVKSIIDSICDRRRGLSWKVNVNALTNSVNVSIFTFNAAIVDLPLGGFIAANTDTVEISLAGDPRVLACPLVTDTSSKFDVVIARGAPILYTLSLQATPLTGQGTSIKDWTSAQQTAYNSAATGDAGYGALDDIEKMAANQAFRQTKAMERVYRYFLWDQTKVVGELDSDLFNSILVPNNMLPVVWPPGGRFASYLPIKFDVDYTTPSLSLSSDKPDPSEEEYIRPFAVIKDDNDNKYYNIHKLARGGDMLTVDRLWSGSLRMRHDQLGVVVDISGPPGQHAIAATEFSAADSTDVEPTDTKLNWQDIIFTCALELDNYSEVQWPPLDPPIVIASDVVKTLIVEVPERRIEYVAKNTVFGIDTAGALKKTSAAGVITDDSYKLQWIAKIAYQWYSVPRQAFTYAYRSLTCPYSVGQLVTNLITTDADADGDTTKEAVNSVITSITIDTRQVSYAIKTSFANLDARSVNVSGVL